MGERSHLSTGGEPLRPLYYLSEEIPTDTNVWPIGKIPKNEEHHPNGGITENKKSRRVDYGYMERLSFDKRIRSF